MAQPHPIEPLDPSDFATDPPFVARTGSGDPGGPVARMQADLARQFAWRPALESPAERRVRRMSAAGGYAALAAGYGAAMLLVLR